jgi:hypothetical protein
MELLANLGLGFSTALTFQNLAYAFLGCVLGTLIGVLPGLGPLATIAMLLPITYTLPPVAALIMLAGIYYGAQYGGSTTAILVNLPGESSSVVTTIDGYQMARRGRAGVALATAGLGSFFAGCVATLILAAFAAPLSELAFKFGPAEYFSLMVLGLIAVVLASGSLVKAIAMIVLGLLLGLVGTDVNSGAARFSFDVPELTDGLNFVSVAMGVFGFAEIIANLEQKEHRETFTDHITNLFPTKADFKRMIPAVLRGTMLGSALGILPGGGASLASFAAYSLEKSGIGQQRRGADLVHPAADAGHSAQRGDGPDGWRHDHPQHPARPAGDDQQSGAVLGPDRLDVDRQLHADRAEPAADRHLGEAAEGALPLPVPGHPDVLLHRRVLGPEHHLRRVPDRGLRRDRLPLHQAALRTGSAAARLRAGADDGRELPPLAAAVAR